MFCTKCGKQYPDGGKCVCQQQQPPQPQQQQPQPQPQQQQQFQQQPQQQQFQQQQYQQPQQPQQFQQQQQYQQPQQQFQQPYYGPVAPADNRKLFSILSYIGILWLIGLLVQPEKNDPRVRFHVGQGIMLSILGFGASIAVSIIMGILGAIFGRLWYTPLWIVTIGSLLQLAVYGVYIFLAIAAILAINKNQDKPLPIIGGMAFYK